MKTIIEAGKGRFSIDLKELFRYKDLFWTLTKRDFKVRYAQSYLGFLWVFAMPAVNIAFAYFIRGATAEGMSKELTLVYSSAAVALWTYFAFVFEQAGGSIISSQQMIRKIYFPRLIAPLSKAILGFIDMGVAMLILAVVMIAAGVSPPMEVVYAPLFILMAGVICFGNGIDDQRYGRSVPRL